MPLGFRVNRKKNALLYIMLCSAVFRCPGGGGRGAGEPPALGFRVRSTRPFPLPERGGALPPGGWAGRGVGGAPPKAGGSTPLRGVLGGMVGGSPPKGGGRPPP